MQWLLQDVSIGHNLLKFRKQNQLTQESVAVKMQLLGSKMSVDTYSKIETGVRNIRISDLLLLAIVFNVEISDFFEGLISNDSPAIGS